MKENKNRIALVAKVIAIITFTLVFVMNVTLFIQSDNKSSDISLTFLTAHAYEDGESGGPVLRLKAEDCKCPNGDKGKTAKCRADGAGELCTKTQQGLTGCYGTSVFNLGKLLCSGI